LAAMGVRAIARPAPGSLHLIIGERAEAVVRALQAAGVGDLAAGAAP